MHDNYLIAFALTVSALGITGLLFALIFIDVPLSTIKDAKQMDDGVAVQVRGIVESTRTVGERTLIVISQPDTLDIMVEQNISVKQDDCIIVRGKKSTYQEDVQITAAKITRCK